MIEKIGTDILKAKTLLENGDLVGIPTETVYGLAANALNPLAVTKIFEAKNRPTFDPLIIHVATVEDFKIYTKNIPAEILAITNQFCPGPITFLLEKRDIIPDIVTSGLGKVAIRVPNQALTLALLQSLDFPLAAPSANPFGYISPTNAQHVANQLGTKVDYILDGGQCQIGLESTIIGFEKNKITVFRKGGLAIESLKKATGIDIIIKDHSDSNPAAPGMLKKHYSPNKNIEIWHKGDTILSPRSGFLGYTNFLDVLPTKNQFLMSPMGNLNEAAYRLFTGLRWLDELDIDNIYIELVPEIELGLAINDRLKRAASQD